MKVVNMHDAKTQLSKLVASAVEGEPFIIAKAGRPMVKVTAIEVREPRRLGFLEGRATIPDDFNEMAAEEINALFAGTTVSDA